MSERWFRQEYECEFLDGDGAVFDMAAVERAFTDAVTPLGVG
jgi:hypothetical protein